MDIIKELLCGGRIYEEESLQGFELRYDGFGKELYSIIKAQLPEVFTHLKFYKAVALTGTHVGSLQDEDSFAIYSDDKIYFAITLDYYGVICVWNHLVVNYETGHWSETPYEDVLTFLQDIFDKRDLLQR
ncbi:hypothetical protein ACLI09_10100 [Flavobacterium sp. RHBU_24]|uniref:hypothetical protein n=1 Tax=Flavobacterium sp. RHBU_24 TaxID=3391185 RepID=UPI003984B1D2